MYFTAVYSFTVLLTPVFRTIPKEVIGEGDIDARRFTAESYAQQNFGQAIEIMKSDLLFQMRTQFFANDDAHTTSTYIDFDMIDSVTATRSLIFNIGAFRVSDKPSPKKNSPSRGK